MILNDCIQLIYKLLPYGLAWNRDPDSDFYKFVSSLAVEICRVNDRLEELLIEIDPFQTDELLEDWEAMLALPDECLADLVLTDDERRKQIVAHLAAQGGASIAYFESLLLTLGFEVDIFDYVVARAGNARAGDYDYGGDVYARAGAARAGDYLYNSGWQFWFNVNSNDLTIDYARAGEARCNERLATFGDTQLFRVARSGVARCGDRLVDFGIAKIECIIRTLKPAHTAVIFSYGPL